MLFPSRISRTQIPQLFDQLGEAHPDVTVFGYAAHHDKVATEEMLQLRQLAERIVNSFDTNAPITAVLTVGYADIDLTFKEKKARAESEYRHSLGRAIEVEDVLLKLIKDLRPRGQRALNATMFKHRGLGATNLKSLKPKNEQERRLNRRVEIFVGQSLISQNQPQLEIVPPKDPDPDFYDNDPNTVLAGNKFQIKMLSADSTGEIGGLTTITFLIWDIKNSRTARYEYDAPILTAGSVTTHTGEGDFSDTFTTPKFIQVDQFGCGASHVSWGAGTLGSIELNLLNNPFLAKPISVKVPSGNSEGYGVEFGKGPFMLIQGSVEVFRGPG
jgi:hypothetical protein